MSSDSDATGGLVHRSGEGASPSGAEVSADRHAETPTDDADDRLSFHGWGLVAVVAVSVLGVPGFIYLYPTVLADLGVPFLVAFLVLPFVPALLLGATAVWSMRRR